MLLLHAFGDESHDSKRKHVLSLAAALAPRRAWNSLSQAWQRTLSLADVKVFHAAECEGAQGEYRGLSASRIEGLQRALIDLVTSNAYDLLCYSCSMELSPYEQLRPRLRPFLRFPKRLRVSGPLDDPYFILYQRIIEEVASESWIAEMSTKETVAFTFDQHHLSVRARAVAEAVSRFRDVGKRVRSASFGDKKVIIPLQVADLLAYETYRFHSDCHLGGQTERWQQCPPS